MIILSKKNCEAIEIAKLREICESEDDYRIILESLADAIDEIAEEIEKALIENQS